MGLVSAKAVYPVTVVWEKARREAMGKRVHVGMVEAA